MTQLLTFDTAEGEVRTEENSCKAFSVYSYRGRTYYRTFDEAIAGMLEILRGYRCCNFCGNKLRKSEGDGPCSDCHNQQCKEKEAEEVTA